MKSIGLHAHVHCGDYWPTSSPSAPAPVVAAVVVAPVPPPAAVEVSAPIASPPTTRTLPIAAAPTRRPAPSPRPHRDDVPATYEAGRTANVLAWQAMRQRYPEAVGAPVEPTRTWAVLGRESVPVGRARAIVLDVVKAPDGAVMAALTLEPAGASVVIGAGHAAQLRRVLARLIDALVIDMREREPAAPTAASEGGTPPVDPSAETPIPERGHEPRKRDPERTPDAH